MTMRDTLRSRRSPTSLMARAAVSVAMAGTAVGHILPRETTPPSGTLNIELWPLQPTPAAMLPAELRRRDFNTVCGYIGGNPDLPATCLDGSHCVVDKEHSAIGCCPDEGDCTTGIYTNCVDDNSPANGVVDPHVFTCGAGDVCYKNTYQGGYFQYGCGSASNLATQVALSATGVPALDYASAFVSVSLRPTTTLDSVASGSSTSSGASTTSGKDGFAEEDSVTKSTSSDGASGSGNNSSAIIGGTIGGIAVLILLIALGVFFWRRKKRYENDPDMDDAKFISRPVVSPDNDFDGPGGMVETRPAPQPPIGRAVNNTESWPIPPTSTTNFGGGNNLEADQVPLTRDINDSSRAYTSSPVGSNPVDDSNSYNGPRRGGERPFWQQTGGGRTRNLTRA